MKFLRWATAKPPLDARAAVFRGESVPQVLLSGNHQKVAEWRREESVKRTKKLRPDLLQDK